MPESFIATQTLTSLLALPIHENFCASKASPWPIRSGSKAMPRPIVPSVDPSGGATR
jgi:hypothetical protein